MADNLASPALPGVVGENTAIERAAALRVIRAQLADPEHQQTVIAALGLDQTPRRPLAVDAPSGRQYAIKLSKRGTRADRRPEHRTAYYADVHRARERLRYYLAWRGPADQRASILRVVGPCAWWEDILPEDANTVREVIHP
jgi:hypothetical protein